MRETVRRMQRKPAVTLLLVLAGLGLAPSPARAQKEPDERRQVVSCDGSGCLVAHLVVDSDGDGVCDADELLAGTDPFDPTSVPPLRQLVELAGKELLPSFENGLAAFLVLPPDIAGKHLRTGASELLSAFPLRDRKDPLAALGISSELLSAHGIDIATQGLTIGLGDQRSGEPPRRVGGMDVRLISDDDGDLAPLKLPTWTGTTAWTDSSSGDFHTVRNYDDHSSDTEVTGGGGVTHGEHTASDGTTTRTWDTTVREYDEGSFHVIEVTTDTSYGDRNTSSTTLIVTNDAGVTTTVKTETEYHRDENGNTTDTTVTTDVTVTDQDGHTTEGHQTQKCDANGENCSSPYINPDADDPSIVTPEMVDHALKRLGTNITTLPGWTAPAEDAPAESAPPKDPHDPITIMLVTPDFQEAAILADVPRLSGAQPETRPDLPSPLDGADPKNPGWPH